MTSLHVKVSVRCEPLKMEFLDMSLAHCYGVPDRDVFAELPKELK